MAGIVHQDVKASGQKGFAAEWNKDHEQTGNHDAEQHQYLNQVIENVVAFPGGPVEGQIVYRTDLNKLYIWNGAAWDDYTPAIPHGTYYWSCAGANFISAQPDVHDILFDPWNVEAHQDNVIFTASVELPHGAVVTKAIVYGNASATAETWHLDRVSHTGINAAMGTDNIGTEDNTIANATIDNENYSYVLRTSSLDTNDMIHGARIEYTL